MVVVMWAVRNCRGEQVALLPFSQKKKAEELAETLTLQTPTIPQDRKVTGKRAMSQWAEHFVSPVKVEQ